MFEQGLKEMFLPRFRLHLAFIGLLGASNVAGCADAGSALGRSPAEARLHAEQLTSSIGARFGPAVPADGFDDVRSRFARSALIPSRLFADSAVWTSFGAESRALRLGGGSEGNRYILGFRDLSRLSGLPGETRRSVDLQRLSGSEYEWAVRDELVVGSVSPDQLGAALTAVFRGAESGTATSAEAVVRGALPRTAASLGRLATLDEITLVPRPDGSTRITIEATLDPRRIERQFPDYARFLERYVARTRLALTAEDATGVDWWRARFADNRLTIDLAVHRGALTPLEGAPRRMPNALRARVDASTRVSIFGVGFSDLVGDVTLRRTAGEKSFVVHFPREPKWHLPLLVEQFIRAPLGRPFEGEGATFGFSASRSGGCGSSR